MWARVCMSDAFTQCVRDLAGQSGYLTLEPAAWEPVGCSGHLDLLAATAHLTSFLPQSKHQ